jgi:uncharacterized Zn-finger protein
MTNKVNKIIQNATLNEDGVVYVKNTKVSCEGSLEFSKHPKVFLKIVKNESGENKIKCPYCTQVFIYKK